MGVGTKVNRSRTSDKDTRGGEEETNRELSGRLGYPPWMKAYGTIPIGYPATDQYRRYRRPLEQVVHWNVYDARQYRRHAQIDFYESTLRPFAMYRDVEAWRRGRTRRSVSASGAMRLPRPLPTLTRVSNRKPTLAGHG